MLAQLYHFINPILLSLSRLFISPHVTTLANVPSNFTGAEGPGVQKSVYTVSADRRHYLCIWYILLTYYADLAEHLKKKR